MGIGPDNSTLGFPYSLLQIFAMADSTVTINIDNTPIIQQGGSVTQDDIDSILNEYREALLGKTIISENLNVSGDTFVEYLDASYINSNYIEIGKEIIFSNPTTSTNIQNMNNQITNILLSVSELSANFNILDASLILLDASIVKLDVFNELSANFNILDASLILLDASLNLLDASTVKLEVFNELSANLIELSNNVYSLLTSYNTANLGITTISGDLSVTGDTSLNDVDISNITANTLTLNEGIIIT